MLHILAGEQSAGRLAIAPRWLVCSSEVLTPDAAEAVTHAFDVVPHNLYATTETGGLAGTCKPGASLHAADDTYIVEVVDENNVPVPPGETGAKTLVTVLFSRTMPLIRYEISGRMTPSRNCTGVAPPRIGVTRLAQLERGPSGKSTVIKTIAR